MSALTTLSAFSNPFPNVPADGNTLTTILQIVFAIIGFIALVNIILAGMKFITSMGKPDEVARARQAIIYAGIGLAIAAAAEIVIAFVIGSL